MAWIAKPSAEYLNLSSPRKKKVRVRALVFLPSMASSSKAAVLFLRRAKEGAGRLFPSIFPGERILQNHAPCPPRKLPGGGWRPVFSLEMKEPGAQLFGEIF